MDELLLALNTYLTDKFVNKNPFQVKAVVSMSDIALRSLLSVNKIPMIQILPLSESHELGPMGDTLSRKYVFRVRVIAHSVDPQKYMQANNEYNILKLVGAIRLALAENKSLGFTPESGKTTSLMINQDAIYFDIIFSETGGHFNASDITITYEVMEEWTGSRNNQSSLLSPIPRPVVIPI